MANGALRDIIRTLFQGFFRYIQNFVGSTIHAYREFHLRTSEFTVFPMPFFTELLSSLLCRITYRSLVLNFIHIRKQMWKLLKKIIDSPIQIKYGFQCAKLYATLSFWIQVYENLLCRTSFISDKQCSKQGKTLFTPFGDACYSLHWFSRN